MYEENEFNEQTHAGSDERHPRKTGARDTSCSSFSSCLRIPESNAPPWAWSAYFDDQLRILGEDLLAEGLRPNAVSKTLKLGHGELRRPLGCKPSMKGNLR